MTNWQGGHAATDVLCPMYPEIWAIEMAAGGPAPDPSLAGVIAPSDRPVILCEYSHAMGNSNGCLGEYFDAFETVRPAAGRLHLGVLGPRPPHSVWRPARGDLAYGGDFGERRHDANFCCDGMVWPDRRPKPAMWEHRNLARPVAVAPVGAAGAWAGARHEPAVVPQPCVAAGQGRSGGGRSRRRNRRRSAVPEDRAAGVGRGRSARRLVGAAAGRMHRDRAMDDGARVGVGTGRPPGGARPMDRRPRAAALPRQRAVVGVGARSCDIGRRRACVAASARAVAGADRQRRIEARARTTVAVRSVA